MASNNVAFVADGLKTVFPNPLAQLPGAVLVNGVSTAFTWTDGNTITFASPPVAGAIVSMVPGSVEITETSEEAPRSEFVPDHKWTGTSLQFRRPDGSFGAGVELSPDPAALPFLAAGPSAVARPWVEKARDHFHLRDYGTPTAGDNSALINAAIAAVNAAGGGYLTMPQGTVPASAITLLGGVTLIGAGKGTASKIQNIGSSAYLIDASGSYGTPVALLADAAAGSDQVQVPTAGLAVGDAVVITDAYEYAPVESVGYTSGETVYIKSIDSASLLTLRTKLYGSMFAGGSYTVANGASARKCNFIESPRIADIELYSDTALLTNAVHFQIARRAKAEDVFIRDFGNRGFVVRGAVDAAIENCGADNLRDNLAGGQAGYGVSAAGPCYGLQVSGGIWTRCRHAFTTQGGSTGYPHLVNVANNIVHDTTAVGMDSHNAGDDLHFEGNIISNINDTGLFIRARNVTVKGGSISRTNGHGISAGETGLFGITIDGVTINTVNGHGVSVAQSCPSLTIKDTQITNAAGDGIQLFLSGTRDSTNLKVLRNIITNFGTVLTNRTGILTTGAVVSTGALIAENTVISGSGSAAYAIRTLLLTGSAVVENKAGGTYSVAVWDIAANLGIDNRKIDATNGRLVLSDIAPTLFAAGPDADYDFILQPKGTGRLRFFYPWASSADAAINGYMEIRDSSGTIRKFATIA